VALERENSDDYLRSMLDRGGSDLEEEVARMTAAHDHAYVLVEDHLDEIEERRPGVAGASVRGSMAPITARYDAPVIPCGDGERLVDVAVRLACKHTEEPSARSLSQAQCRRGPSRSQNGCTAVSRASAPGPRLSTRRFGDRTKRAVAEGR
jgi:ERCC4-type nuclease